MTHILKKIILSTAALAAVLCIKNLHAAAGTLDPFFSLCSTTGNPQSLYDRFQGIAIQSDDKIIGLGSSSIVGATSAITTSIVSLSRWNAADGTLDTSFNSAGDYPGFQTLSVGDTTVGQSVTLQADGKIVVCGYAHQAQTDFLVARYNTDGTIDTGFNTIGYNTTSFGTGAQANSVKVQSNGNIVVAGSAVEGFPKFALARYDSSGTLLSTTTTQIGFSATLNQIAILSDDSIIAVGYMFDGVTTQFAVAKYTPTGVLDGSFGVGGVVTTAIGTKAEATSVVIQADGSIVAAGTSLIGKFARWTLVRYTATGALDGTFGSGGIVASSLQYGSRAQSVTLQPDGKIIVSGSINGNFGPFFAVGRYTTTGALDPSFNANGIGQNPGSSACANSVALQSDGKIIGGGFIKISGSLFFFLARWFA